MSDELIEPIELNEDEESENVNKKKANCITIRRCD